MDYYLPLKLIHILSSTVFFGTGIGSAFYMFMANRRKEIEGIYFAVRHVVIADWIFTTPTVFIQPLTGIALLYVQGYSWTDRWILVSLILYVFAGLCWLPVVVMQIKMRDMARESLQKRTPLPSLYWTFDRWWISLGTLAFVAISVIFYLMVFKPS